MTKEEALKLLSKASPAQLRVVQFLQKNPSYSPPETPSRILAPTAKIEGKYKAPSNGNNFSTKGRIKCCGKFRTPSLHEMHLKRKAHTPEGGRAVGSRKESYDTLTPQLSVEEIQMLRDIIAKIQKEQGKE